MPWTLTYDKPGYIRSGREKSPIISPDHESGSLLETFRKFVRKCRLLCVAIQARITPLSTRLACYQRQTGNGLWKIGGLSDHPSPRLSGQFGLATESGFPWNLHISNLPFVC